MAVSGGPDSLALALLASRWTRVLALVVDHGLRAESAAEAGWTVRQLEQRGIPARLLTLTDLTRGPAMAERARDARYRILRHACCEAGLIDLLLGHHRRDQAETALMRRAAGSGEAGLSAMSALAEQDDVRLVRPLLSVAPGRLRATLAAAAQTFIDDPSNRDQRARRAYIRARLQDADGDGPRVDRLCRRSIRAGSRRAAIEEACAEELARHVTLFPEGCALVEGVLSAPSLAILLRTISGRRYAPPLESVTRFTAHWRAATLHGCRIMQAGRLPGDWLIVREFAAMQHETHACDGVIWDGRFQLFEATSSHLTIGPAGADLAKLRRRSDLPAYVLASTPALRRSGTVIAAPYIHGLSDENAKIFFRPTVALSPSTFFKSSQWSF